MSNLYGRFCSTLAPESILGCNTAGVENDGIICVCIPFIELTPSRRQTDLREQFSTILQIDGEDAPSLVGIAPHAMPKTWRLISILCI